MPRAHSVIAGLWIAFLVCWLILGQFNKKASRDTPRWSGWGVRLAIAIGALVVLRIHGHAAVGLAASVGRYLPVHSGPVHPGIASRWTGVGLALAGFALAFWARAHLGRNWGMPMSLRQGHELVTSGPYARVRHPIYSGVMLAMIGSALTVGIPWLALFALYFAYFLFSARMEERMMLAQFPETYPAYRRRTRMLIPLVL